MRSPHRGAEEAAPAARHRHRRSRSACSSCCSSPSPSSRAPAVLNRPLLKDSAGSRRPTSRAYPRSWSPPLRAFAVAMVGASYAAVPLYDLFCKRHRLRRHDPGRDRGASAVARPRFAVRFDSNVARASLDASSRRRPIKLRTGEVKTVYFKVINHGADHDAGMRPTTSRPKAAPTSTRSSASASPSRLLGRARSSNCPWSSSSIRRSTPTMTSTR